MFKEALLRVVSVMKGRRQEGEMPKIDEMPEVERVVRIDRKSLRKRMEKVRTYRAVPEQLEVGFWGRMLGFPPGDTRHKIEGGIT